MRQTLYYIVFTMSLVRIYYTIVTHYVPYLSYLFAEDVMLFVLLFLMFVVPAISSWSVKQLLEDWSLFLVTAILISLYLLPIPEVQLILRC